MMTIKNPEKYINEPGSCRHSGAQIAKYGKRPLIIGGSHALEAVGKEFFEDLKENGIDETHVETFTGYPSERQFERYAQIAKEIQADSVIGIGGGRVLDTAKATAGLANIPVITIPTVAATCAAWAALIIQYDDEGAYVKHRKGQPNPRLVIVDPEVVLQAPERYTLAGVVDTFAKYYEKRPIFEKHPDNVTFNISFYAATWAFQRLQEVTWKALDEAKQGIYGEAARDLLDAIFYIAGFAGSFQDGNSHYSFAHPFYHCSTRLPNTHGKLHGEKVAFGIIAQLCLEEKPEEEILETIQLFDQFHNAFTLADLGISEHVDEDVDFLDRDIPNEFAYAGEISKKPIRQAILEADQLTKRIKTRS
jgi:glycerol dehydrogenase